MPMPKLTDEQYRDLNGSICPYCGSREIVVSGKVEVGKLYYDPDRRTQTVTCTDCSEQWYDLHPQQGFMPINVPDLDAID